MVVGLIIPSAWRLFLALVLGVAAVQFDHGPIDAKAPDASAPVLAGTPSAPAAQLVRAKVDKFFAIIALAPADLAALQCPHQRREPAAPRAPQPPNLSLDCPPLAPRPPPAV